MRPCEIGENFFQKILIKLFAPFNPLNPPAPMGVTEVGGYSPVPSPCHHLLLSCFSTPAVSVRL